MNKEFLNQIEKIEEHSTYFSHTGNSFSSYFHRDIFIRFLETFNTLYSTNQIDTYLDILTFPSYIKLFNDVKDILWRDNSIDVKVKSTCETFSKNLESIANKIYKKSLSFQSSSLKVSTEEAERSLKIRKSLPDSILNAKPEVKVSSKPLLSSTDYSNDSNKTYTSYNSAYNLGIKTLGSRHGMSTGVDEDGTYMVKDGGSWRPYAMHEFD